MMQKNDVHLANLSQQQPNVHMEELTPNPEVFIQLMMDGVGRRKLKEVHILGAG